MHLLRHLLISLLLLLCRSLRFEGFNAGLEHNHRLESRKRKRAAHRGRNRTFLSASFSSFISFSLALTRAIATRSFARFSYGVKPEPGRNAFLGSCHCLPVVLIVSENSLGAATVRCWEQKGTDVPFFLMPSGFAADGALSTFGADIVSVICRVVMLPLRWTPCAGRWMW